MRRRLSCLSTSEGRASLWSRLEAWPRSDASPPRRLRLGALRSAGPRGNPPSFGDSQGAAISGGQPLGLPFRSASVTAGERKGRRRSAMGPQEQGGRPGGGGEAGQAALTTVQLNRGPVAADGCVDTAEGGTPSRRNPDPRHARSASDPERIRAMRQVLEPASRPGADAAARLRPARQRTGHATSLQSSDAGCSTDSAPSGISWLLPASRCAQEAHVAMPHGRRACAHSDR